MKTSQINKDLKNNFIHPMGKEIVFNSHFKCEPLYNQHKYIYYLMPTSFLEEGDYFGIANVDGNWQIQALDKTKGRAKKILQVLGTYKSKKEALLDLKSKIYETI